MSDNPLLRDLQEMPDDASVHSSQIKGNPLIEKIKLPGKVFKLPSSGLMYTNNELNKTVTDAEIHIKPLSALTEINMRNAEMLMSGRAFDEIIKECVPEVNKPSELFGKDVDAIMCFLRIITYGNEFEFEYAHSCDNKNHTYTADLNHCIERIKTIDEEYIEKNYTVNLPSGQIVKLHPYRLKDIIKLVTNVDDGKSSVEDYKKQIVDSILNMITSVDGYDDKQMISEWLATLTSPTIQLIVNKMDSAEEWGPDFTTDIQCKSCGETVNVELPINPINFFSA